MGSWPAKMRAKWIYAKLIEEIVPRKNAINLL